MPLEVVVVDNASRDNTVNIVEKDKIFKLFALNENLGFGKANNVGLSYALAHSADYLFLLRVQKEDWIKTFKITVF